MFVCLFFASSQVLVFNAYANVHSHTSCINESSGRCCIEFDNSDDSIDCKRISTFKFRSIIVVCRFDIIDYVIIIIVVVDNNICCACTCCCEVLTLKI